MRRFHSVSTHRADFSSTAAPRATASATGASTSTAAAATASLALGDHEGFAIISEESSPAVADFAGGGIRRKYQVSDAEEFGANESHVSHAHVSGGGATSAYGGSFYDGGGGGGNEACDEVAHGEDAGKDNKAFLYDDVYMGPPTPAPERGGATDGAEGRTVAKAEGGVIEGAEGGMAMSELGKEKAVTGKMGKTTSQECGQQ